MLSFGLGKESWAKITEHEVLVQARVNSIFIRVPYFELQFLVSRATVLGRNKFTKWINSC